MKIIIEAYNPIWQELFEQERKSLTGIFNGVDFKIEHIGSTSIVGLGAKPVIDLMVGLSDFSIANHLVEDIEKLGYQYISEYEITMPYRRFFIKENDEKRTHHIHMVKLNSDFWIKHLAFRNHLRENIQTKEEYYQLKKKLASLKWKSGDDYANAKSEFINRVLVKAMSSI